MLRLFKKKAKPVRVLMLGLDNAGKTTMMYKLGFGEIVTTIPTVGFHVDSIENDEYYITCHDLGGADKISPLWRCYYAQNDAVIFMVDTTERDRFDEVLRRLTSLTREEKLLDKPFLVLANKQDLPNSMPGRTLSKELNLHEILEDRPWYIIDSCSFSGEGLKEGLAWISNKVGSVRYPD